MDLCNFSWFSFCPAVFLIHWHPQAIYSSSVFFFCFTIAIQEVRHCSAIPLILPLPGQEENLLTLIASARPWTMCSQLYHSQPSENPSIIFYIVLYNRRNLNGIITCTICLCNSSDSHHWYRQTAQTVQTVQTVHFSANEFPVSMAQISWL